MTLASMSWPTELVRKVVPALARMAANQGNTSTIIHAKPANGLSDQSQRPERSAIDSVIVVSPTNIRINGPLIKTPAAIAVHRIAGSRQPTGTSGVRRVVR